MSVFMTGECNELYSLNSKQTVKYLIPF